MKGLRNFWMVPYCWTKLLMISYLYDMGMLSYELFYCKVNFLNLISNWCWLDDPFSKHYMNSINSVHFSIFQTMAQEQLIMENFKLLGEDQIKIEPDDEITLACLTCGYEECVDICSERNTSPFYCSECERGEWTRTNDDRNETSNVLIKCTFQMTITAQCETRI